MEGVSFGIDRDSILCRETAEELSELRERRYEFFILLGHQLKLQVPRRASQVLHLRPLSSNSALVFVASKFSINFSIASIGGKAAMVLRNNCTRSHSSG